MDRPGKTPEENTDDEVRFCQYIDVVEIWILVAIG